MEQPKYIHVELPPINALDEVKKMLWETERFERYIAGNESMRGNVLKEVITRVEQKQNHV